MKNMVIPVRVKIDTCMVGNNNVLHDRVNSSPIYTRLMLDVEISRSDVFDVRPRYFPYIIVDAGSAVLIFSGKGR